MDSEQDVEMSLKEHGHKSAEPGTTVAPSEVPSVSGGLKYRKITPSAASVERQLKHERAQRALENAALLSKKIKEHRKNTAELLGRTFEEEDHTDAGSEVMSVASEHTSYSVATDAGSTLSVQEALKIPGISESLANTLKQKELLMERIKQYKEISKRPSPSPLKRDAPKQDKSISKKHDENEIIKLQNLLADKDLKIKQMESTIAELQEKICEKDLLIDAKTKATSLISDDLSKKEQNAMAILEDTKLQMKKMQENFLKIDNDWKFDKSNLTKEIEYRNEKIKSLEEANKILEEARFELSVANAKLSEQLDEKNEEIKTLQSELKKFLSETDNKDNYDKTMQDTDAMYSEIEKLKQINEELTHQVNSLQESKRNIEAKSFINEIQTLKAELSDLQLVNSELMEKLENQNIDDRNMTLGKEKGSLEIEKMIELTKKIELLEDLNCQIRQKNLELEAKLMPSQDIASTTSPKKSPQVSRKSGKPMRSIKSKSPWASLAESPEREKKVKQDAPKADESNSENIIQSLNKQILNKEYIISENERLVKMLQEENNQQKGLLKEKDEQLERNKLSKPEVKESSTETLCQIESEKFVDTTLDYDKFTPDELKQKLIAAQNQIDLLNKELDASNKSMIKIKSANKLKLRQLQKTIDNFAVMSDAHSEVSKLSEQVNSLTVKVAELEEEKGNLQLHLVDYDSGRMTESEVYKRMLQLEALSETRLKAISDLETQKFDLVQELHNSQQKCIELEDKLTDTQILHNEHVCSEIKSVELEEQIDNLNLMKNELSIVIENLKLDNEQLNATIKRLEEEKIDISNKLEHYMQENIELTDRFEKLSAEKVSSAESIEMVESLTAQEKLELEEYNKKMKKPEEAKTVPKDTDVAELNENITKLTEESAELNLKIELFTQERHEVMDKMNALSFENEALQHKIANLVQQSMTLENNLKSLNAEKSSLSKLNEELLSQIKQLKDERAEICKHTSLMAIGSVNEDIQGSGASDFIDDNDEKSSKIKGKNIKTMTKEILKLKNIIKEREAELADCQVKILSLEEQNQKQEVAVESTLKAAYDEINQLKENRHRDNSEATSGINSSSGELDLLILSKEEKINRLESNLLAYENNIKDYVETIEQKDKELNEYINEITKLNDLSQKLKASIESLEEKRYKEQNNEINLLNKQITAYQTKLNENEIIIKNYHDDKMQIVALKSELEMKLEHANAEIAELTENLAEKQKSISDLKSHKDYYDEEIATLKEECKNKDEEIHAVKLQLRRESIDKENVKENLNELQSSKVLYEEKLITLSESLTTCEEKLKASIDEINAKDTKIKEIMERLKKYAATLKKKTVSCNELESELSSVRIELEETRNQIELLKNSNSDSVELKQQVDVLHGELLHFKQQYSIEHNKSVDFEKQVELFKQLELDLTNQLNAITHSESHYKSCLEQQVAENASLNNQMQINLQKINELSCTIEQLNNRLAEHEIEQRNNSNLLTKISSLESDINQKQLKISELVSQLEAVEQTNNLFKYGCEAKIQERDLYIENLEAEIDIYKKRIIRLEDSVSSMEERRRSLERKADQLDNQLTDKQKAYQDYHHTEDELVNRLAVLMEHDKIVEKQLQELEKENFILQNKLQNIIEQNQEYEKKYIQITNENVLLKNTLAQCHHYQSESVSEKQKVSELEIVVKKLTTDSQNQAFAKKREIEDLESEFNSQIENSIKEKKNLAEKCEKLNEIIIQLEEKLLEYDARMCQLSINAEELTRYNKELQQKLSTESISKEKIDYTDQYINEINKLQAAGNAKNVEIDNLKSEMIALQNHSRKTIESLQKEMTYLNQQIHDTTRSIHDKNEQAITRQEKDDNSFETIQSKQTPQIETSVENDSSKLLDLTALESQIIMGELLEAPLDENVSQHIANISLQPCKEEVIVPKKAYVCFKNDESLEESSDPFNSDAGWGLSESSSTAYPEIESLNQQVSNLSLENVSLKNEIAHLNAKLVKAVKKLREYKQSNETLQNELKIGKQIDNMNSLNFAIEDELNHQIKELNAKLTEINKNLQVERQEKEIFKNRNEDLAGANERLMKMKENLDNEIELWKDKFKEVNDRLASMEWNENPKLDEVSDLTQVCDAVQQKNLESLLKENDELNATIDELTEQSIHFALVETRLKDQIVALNNQIAIQENTIVKLNDDIVQLQSENCTYKNEYDTLKNELMKTQKQIVNEDSKSLVRSEKLEMINNDLKLQLENAVIEKQRFETEISSLRESLQAYTLQLTSVISEAEYKSILDKYKNLELQCEKLTIDLHNASKEIDEYKFALREMDSLTSKTSTENKDNSINSDSSLATIKNLGEEIQIANQKIKNYENRLAEFEEKNNKLNEENSQLLSNMTELQSSVSLSIDQRGMEVAEMWKQHLNQREVEFSLLEQELQTQIATLETKHSDLMKSVQNSDSKNVTQLVSSEQISSLEQILKQREEKLIALQEKDNDYVSQIELLRLEMNDEKVLYESKLLSQQEEYESQIKKITKECQNDSQQSHRILELTGEISSIREYAEELVAENNDMKNKLELAEQQILELTNKIAIKDSELHHKVEEFEKVFAQKTDEFEALRNLLIEYEKKIEDLSFEKESELALIRLKLHENNQSHSKEQEQKESEKEELIIRLEEKIKECTKLSQEIFELKIFIEERNTKVNEMQLALENQELVITSMKKELLVLQEAFKSAKIQKHVTFATDTKPGDNESQLDPKDLADSVPKAELDLALYLLHQRDMRCEELTVEITQLLEERDTLQLRLSDCLRSIEELKRMCVQVGVDIDVKAENFPSSVTVENEARSRSSLSEEDEKAKLQAKVCELRARSVRQSRDVWLRQERELRQLDMRRLQQDLALLPHEAATHLSQSAAAAGAATATATEGEPESSTSVLLNWILGKSTPRVVHM